MKVLLLRALLPALIVLKSATALGRGDLDPRLASLVNSSATPLSSAFSFVRMKDGKSLLSYQAALKLSPASLTKLVTAGAILHHFGPSYSLTTRVYHTGTFRDGVVSGDLVFVGNGDPLITSEKLWQFAADLRLMGVKEIKGDLVIDNSLFDTDVDGSRIAGATRSQNAYDAPISAFGINFNTVAAAIYPGSRVGAAARVGLDPVDLPIVQIKNNALTSTGRSGAGGLMVTRQTSNKKNDVQLQVAGKIGADSDLVKIYRSMPDASLLSGQYLKAFLTREGLRVGGGIRSATLPANAKLLYSLSGYPLQKAVEGLNKYSNNFIADVLTKRLGAEFANPGSPLKTGSGTYANGIKVLNDFLQIQVGIKDNFSINNGSGLDTNNRLSVDQITKLLGYMEQRLDVFPEFIASFPIAGVDGSLKKRRISERSSVGFIRAKTGTLSEPIAVIGLAGYVQHPTHGLCAFAIIQNGKEGQRQPGLDDLRQRQDALIAHFLEKI